jgi:Xaa-Pro aminopeptidase
MRYHPIPSALFIGNRRRFIETLPPGAFCVIHSNDVQPTNADGTRSFIQNSNLFWLTGIDQEETILLLFPDCPVPERREILFIRQTNEHIAIWEGNKLSKEIASEISGISRIQWTSSFDGIFKKCMSEASQVFLSLDQHAGKPPGPEGLSHRFANTCRKDYPLHEFRNAAALISALRMIKAPAEIDLMRRACEITARAFRQACTMIKPGVYEYEIEAEYAREILRDGARGFAYEPIIASGENSCILHYVLNDRKCNAGEIILMDVGASYANYAADMTRTVPVSGRFSKRQRDVYNAVLQIFKETSDLLRPGITLSQYHERVDEIADQVLVELGLISVQEIKRQDAAKPARNTYFLHRTSHFLGLDVHDCQDLQEPLKPGVALTCEPGIYIREEGLGIRLENDFVITEDGHEDLMSSVPLEADEIEALIQHS